ncbi:MAG: NAD(P)H-dependent oxidoreductase subunit E [Woeseiaceae bacterium]|nr:NAD(P)H-dependent oxidoreductase subunit E [Woeseiaceae bacterium]
MTANGYNKEALSQVISDFQARPEMLVQILQALTKRIGWISESAVRQLADELNLSRADVHGVVSFYHDFRTTPAGKHVVRICQAEACQAMGSRELTVHAEKVLGVTMHGTNDDVSLEPTYCLGNCACSPAVMIDEKTYGRVSTQRFDQLVDTLREGG